jgi:hypothetical protein
MTTHSSSHAAARLRIPRTVLVPLSARCAWLVVGATLLTTAAHAQTAPVASLHVFVRDSAGGPVVGADLSIVRDLRDVLAAGQTSARGESVLSFSGADTVVQVIVRKIGYQRSQQFVSVNRGAATTASFTLARAVTQLAPVTVTATEDVRRKSYFIDAEELEKSPRPIVDALDIVQKLKPDMIWGRRGAPDLIDQHVAHTGRRVPSSRKSTIDHAMAYGYCPPDSTIFVNGERVRGLAISDVAVAKLVGPGKLLNATIATVLASIKPEHIAEMSYLECTSHGVDTQAEGSNAIYVVLKDGVRFMPGIGSYVEARAQQIAARPATQSYRARILGVFDEQTGAPLDNVDVLDILNGVTARTTSTGTVSLVYLPDGGSTVSVSKAGYFTQTLSVAISPHDTVGVTLLLSRVATGVPKPSPLR